MILSALSCCEVPVSKSHVEISIHPCKAPQHTVILRFSSPTLAARARNLLIINGDQGKVTAPKTWGASWGSHLEAVGSGSGIAHQHDPSTTLGHSDPRSNHCDVFVLPLIPEAKVVKGIPVPW